jgi:hypothetical protein
MLLRYAHEDMEDTVLQNGSVGKVAWKDDWTPEGKITRTEERTLEINSHNF